MPNMWGESVISGPRARDIGDRKRTSIICGRVVECCKIRSFQTIKSLNIHVTCFLLTCVCSFLFTKAVNYSCAMFLKHTLRGRVMFWSCLAFTFFFKNNLPHYCLARSSVFKKLPKAFVLLLLSPKVVYQRGYLNRCMALDVRSMQYFQIVLQAEIRAKPSTRQDLRGLESLPLRLYALKKSLKRTDPGEDDVGHRFPPNALVGQKLLLVSKGWRW